MKMKAGMRMLLLFLALSTRAVQAQMRFPRPEFSSGYTQPITHVPAPPSAPWEWCDLAVLAAALGLAAWLALRRRSRAGLFVLTLFALAYFGFWRKGCICPVGAVQNLVQSAVDPACALPFGVLLTFLLPLAAALIWGRVFCAAVCPLGAAQEAVIVRPLRLPRWLTEVLRLIPVVYLALALMLAAGGGTYLICRYDPFVAFFRFSALPGMFALGIAFLALGTVIARPYCRFLCPYGVLLGWASCLSRRHLSIAPGDCIECRLCSASCPVDAIEPPRTAREGVLSRRKGSRRFALMLCLWPVLIAAGAWLGSALHVPLSGLDQSVQRAERLVEEEETGLQGVSFDTAQFRAAGLSLTKAVRDARAVRNRVRVMGWWGGGLVGLIVGARLIAWSRRRSQDGFLPNREQCLSCGRCLDYCPVKPPGKDAPQGHDGGNA